MGSRRARRGPVAAAVGASSEARRGACERPEVLRWVPTAAEELVVVPGCCDEVPALAAVLRAVTFAWEEIQSPKILSAAATVGFSRRAGVPVRERERRVDLPKEPVSGAPRRFLAPGRPSCLRGRKLLAGCHCAAGPSEG